MAQIYRNREYGLYKALATEYAPKQDAHKDTSGNIMKFIIMLIIFHKFATRVSKAMKGAPPIAKAGAVAATAEATIAGVEEVAASKLPFNKSRFKNIMRRHFQFTGRKSGIELSILDDIIDDAFASVKAGTRFPKAMQGVIEFLGDELKELQNVRLDLDDIINVFDGSDDLAGFANIDSLLFNLGKGGVHQLIEEYSERLSIPFNNLEEVIIIDGEINLQGLVGIMGKSEDQYLVVSKTLLSAEESAKKFLGLFEEARNNTNPNMNNLKNDLAFLKEKFEGDDKEFRRLSRELFDSEIEKEMYSKAYNATAMGLEDTYDVNDYIRDNKIDDLEGDVWKDMQNSYNFKFVASSWIAAYLAQVTEYSEGGAPISGRIHLMFKNWEPFTTIDFPWTIVSGFMTAVSKGAYYMEHIKGSTDGISTDFFPDEAEEGLNLSRGVNGKKPETADRDNVKQTQVEVAVATENAKKSESFGDIVGKGIVKKFRKLIGLNKIQQKTSLARTLLKGKTQFNVANAFKPKGLGNARTVAKAFGRRHKR